MPPPRQLFFNPIFGVVAARVIFPAWVEGDFVPGGLNLGGKIGTPPKDLDKAQK